MKQFFEVVKAYSIYNAKFCLGLAESSRKDGDKEWARTLLHSAKYYRELALYADKHLRRELVVSKRSAVDRVMDENSYLREVEAGAAEARLHIDALHAVIKTGDLKTAELLINDWEADQCPF